jgi:surfactin synthase thioesterase subunit
LTIQYPGRQDRLGDPLVDTIEGLADACVAELRPWLDRPVVLFGHSMGAAVAFEVARRLERTGTALLGLIASGGRAPSLPRTDRIHERDEAGLVEEMAKLNGTDAETLGDIELLRMVLPALRSDYQAIEMYCCEPEDTVRAPILVLTGADDDRVSPEQAGLWSRHTTGSCTVEVLPGGHFFPTAEQERVTGLVREHVAAWSGARRR